MSTTALFSSPGTEPVAGLPAAPRLLPAWAAQPLVIAAEIEAYIPQQYPFALVDTLYHCQPGEAWAGLRVSPDNLLVQDGYLSEAGILESMAQAVALKAGYEAQDQAAPARVGFIAALKQVHLYALVPVGTTLVTHVRIVLQALDVLVVQTTSGYDTTLVADGEMRLFLEPEPALDVAIKALFHAAVPTDHAHC